MMKKLIQVVKYKSINIFLNKNNIMIQYNKNYKMIKLMKIHNMNKKHK